MRFTLRPISNEKPDSASLTRREWFTRISAPAVAAALVPALMEEQAFAAPSKEIKTEEDAGVRVYNVRQYGAKGDGKALDTAAVQATIDACNRDGGGTVLVPAGTFVIGTVEL